MKHIFHPHRPAMLVDHYSLTSSFPAPLKSHRWSSQSFHFDAPSRHWKVVVEEVLIALSLPLCGQYLRLYCF